MEFHIDKKVKEPLYSQLAKQLITMIENGIYQNKERLPAEVLLAKKSGVAVGTVKAAYKILREEGYISSVRGGGSYVIYQRKITELSPAELVDSMYRCLQKDMSIVQIRGKVQRELICAYHGKRKVQAAFLDFSDEILHGVRPVLEKIKNLYVKTYRLDKILGKEERIDPQCELVLVSQKYFADMVGYADENQIQIEPLALRGNHNTLERMMLLPEEHPVCILYRSEAFLKDMKDALQMIGRQSRVFAVDDSRWEQETEYWAKSGAAFLIPADYLEYCQAGTLQLLSRARKYGCEIIPYVYEIDGGSFVILEETIQNLCIAKGGIEL